MVGPVGGEMAWISDHFPMRRSFFFEKFSRQISAVFLGSIVRSSGPGGVPRDPPYFGVTSVGPKVVLVLGPSLSKIQEVLFGQNSCID